MDPSGSTKYIMILFEKEYDAESLCDVERDVYEALNYNSLTMTPDGFAEGYFTVTISWRKDYE